MNSKIKRIIRKCLVCDKRINIKIYEDGHYIGGYYFNKLKIPIGKGQYKKVSTSKFLGKKVNIVKWTGKEREIEYWECNDCYEEAMHEYWLEQIIKKLYGGKCPDFEKECACCNAWGVYDTIIDSNRGII